MQAVADVWYHIDSNHLFCLLGHNGAGKVSEQLPLTLIRQLFIYNSFPIHTDHNHQHAHGSNPSDPRDC